jgi:hypothetical protein
VSIASPLTRPSPFPRRVGIRIFTFEACSGFTRVTARWIAQPPKAAFVTRLQPSQLPDQTARQLPEQSTTLRVEPSSTGDTRRRGARRAFFPKALYRARARIEHLVGKLKRFKRIALRCEKTNKNFASFVAFALGLIIVKSVHTA